MKKSLTLKNRIIITPKEYSVLEFTSKNRDIRTNHVSKMQKSVMRHGCLRLVIVVWDKKLEKYIIVDGQHLSKALMSINRNSECQIVDCKDESEMTQLMIDLNNTSQSWRPNDYIHNWAESGKEDYILVRKAIQRNTMQLTVVLMAYAQKRRNVATNEMKEGTFKIVDANYGDKLIDQIRDCNNFISSSRAVNEALVQVMLNTKKYNHKRMLKNLRCASKTVKFETSETKLYNQLLEIYNG
jgi:hypothetical protein